MSQLLIRRACLATMNDGAAARRGPDAMNQAGIIPRGDVWLRDGTIVAVEPSRDDSALLDQSTRAALDRGELQVIEAEGRVLLPGLVNCHTHACWTGSRVDEWRRQLQGAQYSELLAAGGGIQATVRAVRAASQAELESELLERLWLMLGHGTTTVEIKSGYGLTTDSELKMLRAIAAAASRWPGRVIATACLGHALDPHTRRETFVQRTIDETLPAVVAEFPGIAIDAYCEAGAWSLVECERLFAAAAEMGCPCRVHADQFQRLGMTTHAARHGFLSVDHLEASTAEEWRALADSETWSVALPCSGFHLDGRYAAGRALIDAGAKFAIATNFNPGSAPCGSLAMAAALACRYMGLTPIEALLACTHQAACLLGLSDAGRIAVGQRADLVLLAHRDPCEFAYAFGVNPVASVIVNGHLHQ